MVMGFLKGIQKRWKEQVQVWKTEQAKSKGKAEVNGVVANGEVVGKKSAEERDPTELKIVVMSVTVVAQRFSDFFDRAPVLYVAGRQHTVNAHYAEEHQPDFLQPDFLDAALETVYQIHTCYPPGSILVFLAGQEEIEGLAASIKSFLPSLQKEFPHAEELLVTPLYAKLHAAEQAKAFLPSPPRTRKVILATNIAETSVTIPGVKYVVDCGLAKEKRYHAGTGIDSLVTESISQSSAKQRTGRAGREVPMASASASTPKRPTTVSRSARSPRSNASRSPSPSSTSSPLAKTTCSSSVSWIRPTSSRSSSPSSRSSA
ncbi:RHTO0S02e06348g1_1 [Rhodotorula toruloides]|uniref:RHTO0S02e06348g1_1 n=1 Tax=Rhodotorula toruloides TaxID=5286 RepID=A0A061AGN4_RHOTO|nr:RHTO0S02e06348g1_1 [Rhodotorula toruloides]